MAHLSLSWGAARAMPVTRSVFMARLFRQVHVPRFPDKHGSGCYHARPMLRSDFHYELPPELIAQTPLPGRTDSRLLCLDGETDSFADRAFADLPDLLWPGDLVVFNDTRVIPARLYGSKDTGGRVEILVERLRDGGRALVHLRASKTPKPGSTLTFEGGVRARVEGREGDLFELVFETDRPLVEVLEAHGHVPLPPYIARPDDRADHDRYQTVFARAPGAAAAPTAGLHFDEVMLARLDARGVERTFVTLHVGAGTFQPVRTERLDEHAMHAEWLEVGEETCAAVAACRARGGRVVAVGTTVVRALETAAANGELVPFTGETRLFITPGYRFQVVDALLTNFHLPESTLIMLVAAFGGYEHVMRGYRHAVDARYRFFSYGDAMFVTSSGDGGNRFYRTE